MRTDRPDPEGPRPWRASMSVALGLGLGFFVMTSVAGVLGVGLVSGYQNTVDLLRQKAELLLSAEESAVREYLDEVEGQVDFLVSLILKGEVEPGTEEDFTSLMLGSMAASPQIMAILFIDGDYQLIGAERREEESSPLFASVKGDAGLKSIVDRSAQGESPRWGTLVWREEYGQALLNYHRRIVVDGKFRGTMLALVSVRMLSEAISDLETEFGENAFILYGRDLVLAHPLMAFGYDGLTQLTPLPKQATYGDPILSGMWEERPPGFLEGRLLSGPGIHSVALGDAAYVFLHRTLDGYTDRDLIIGTYFRSSDLLSEVGRLKWAIFICLGIAVIAALTAGFIGRQIAQPVNRLARGATRIHDLDLEHVEPIPGSFFTELADAARAFNAMLDGLRWFERYVPKSLVVRLVRLHGQEGIRSAEQAVAVMFTDITSFSAVSERMDATSVAELLNTHFSIIAHCVEAEGGTVDKFIGDSVMAIWGAPEDCADRADRACRTALSIERELRAYNERQRQAGAPTIRLRIGIHVGTVVVGNIGSAGRVNYTVIGDAVNVAQRLEELGKVLGRSDDEVNVLLTDDVVAELDGAFDLTPLGPQQVRGRRDEIAVSVLEGEAAA